MGCDTTFTGGFDIWVDENPTNRRQPNEMETAYIERIINNGPNDRNAGFRYIDLKISNKNGIKLKHSGAEKTSDLDNQIVYVLTQAKRQIPGLVFTGEIEAHDEYNDHYKLVMSGDKVLTKRPKVSWE